MISLARLEANRRNALRSTGPRTEEGKQRSRLNAVRHGLTAETVVTSLEDAEDYMAFQAAIISDYEPETAVARELVLRLASLLWRLRRANAIEADLFEMQAEFFPGRRRITAGRNGSGELHTDDLPRQGSGADHSFLLRDYKTAIRDLTKSFLRLAKQDSRAFACLNRYEVALWRQTKQTLCALQPSRRRYR